MISLGFRSGTPCPASRYHKKSEVPYEDTGCGGVVYYANDLTYFERARTEYLLAHGISVKGSYKLKVVPYSHG